MEAENEGKTGNNGRPYKVGKGKPPSEYQWRKGMSGNRNGRPKRRSKSLSEQLSEILDQPIETLIKGKRAKISKLNLIINGLVKSVASGKAGGASVLMELYKKVDEAQTKTGESLVEARISIDTVRERIEQLAARQRVNAGLPPDYLGSVDQGIAELKAKQNQKEAE